MSRKTTCIAITYAALGIAMGIVVLFAFDMVVMHGQYLAHHFKANQPDCGGQCHASRSYYQHPLLRRYADTVQRHG